MSLKRVLVNSRQRQHGSMLVIALFVIVVLAYLGLTVTKLLSASNDKVIYEVLGQKALNAARSGIECRIAATITEVINTNCSNGAKKEFTNVPGLENCQYTSQVDQKTVKDKGITKFYYQFSSTGQCAVGNVVVSRTVYVDAMQ